MPTSFGIDPMTALPNAMVRVMRRCGVVWCGVVWCGVV